MTMQSCIILNLIFKLGLRTAIFSVLICWDCRIKPPQAGWLKQQKFTLLQSWRRKSEFQVLAEVVSPEASRFADGRLLPVFSHHHPSVHVCVLISSSKSTSHIGLRPILMISFNLIISLKTLSPNTVTF